MLTKFEVTNFKNFDEKLTFDLTNTKMYEFNKECVIKGVVNKALIYGHNGIGKSNLGFAIFDLISHLTDKNKSVHSYDNYLNASNGCSVAIFRYEFQFKEGAVIYEYGKSDLESIIHENIKINGNDYASIDRTNSSVACINVNGAENLNRDIGESKISIITYIKNNSVLEKNSDNACFNKFLDFVNGMLFFRSLEQNNYIGFEQGSSELAVDIIEKENVKDFEHFLNKAGIECKLDIIEVGDRFDLAFDFNGKMIPFYDIASQGTRSLELFYYWFQRLKENTKVTFVFIDEFDAFYHHSLSNLIIEMLKSIHAQVIMTTHNVSIMTNDLLRPDCYFLLKNNAIQSLANSTEKELREAHNIEKMYRAGAFSG